MPESRRAGRLSGGKGPPLASTKRGALPQTRFITGNGQPYGCPFPVFRRDNDVIRWRAVCWRAVCGPLDAKESGRDWLRAKKIFRRRQARTEAHSPQSGHVCPLAVRGDVLPVIRRRGPAIQTRRKVFSGWGRAREGEGQFLPKNAPPPLASLSLSPVQTGQALIVMPGGTTAKTSLQLVELVHGFASVGDIMHQDLALL